MLLLKNFIVSPLLGSGAAVLYGYLNKSTDTVRNFINYNNIV